jgi:hypothetical protein
MKIHIAARHELRPKALGIAERLTAAGHRVISRWLLGGGTGVPVAENALYTLTDVSLADCVVLLAESPWQHKDIPGASERHVEFGYALRAGKRLCVLGPRETGFCHLPDVERYRTVKELVDGLR